MADYLLRATLTCIDRVDSKLLRELFIVSCLAGDYSTIEQLAILDVDWHGNWAQGFSPLVATAWNPDIRIAKMVLECGAISDNDISGFPHASMTPLPIHVATCYGNTDFVQWLIGHGTSLDVQLTSHKDEGLCAWQWFLPSMLASPLQLALESGNVDTVSQLLHTGLLGGELIQAIRLGNESITSNIMLREKNITFVDAYGDTILEAAVEVGNRDIISLFFSSGGNYRSLALLKAVEAALVTQEYSIVLLLVMNRATRLVDRYEVSALVMAIEKKQLALIDILLGDQFIPRSLSSFHRRGWLRHRVFRTKSSSIGMTPLRAAINSGDTVLAKKIIQAGYRAGCKDLYRDGMDMNNPATSLFWSHFPPTNDHLRWTRHVLFSSIQSHMPQMIQQCIDCLDSLDYYVESRTPLQKAVEEGNTSLVDLLIDAGADVNTPPAWYQGATALQLAAIKGNMSIARSLLDRQVDVNAPPGKVGGRTALEGASEHGKLDMVQLLLEEGVQLDGAMRIHYIRAVRYAKSEGHLALAKHLQDFGGWTSMDQEVYDRKDILKDEGRFIFDEETKAWHFRHYLEKAPSDADSIVSSLSRTDSDDSQIDGDFNDHSVHFEDDSSEFHNGPMQDQENDRGNITQAQGNGHETYMLEMDAEYETLLMERYLNTNFQDSWDYLDGGENEFPNIYGQNTNERMGNIVQEQDDEHETYMLGEVEEME